MKIPLVFQIDRRDGTGYGLVMSKKFGDPDVLIRKTDPHEDRIIKLDLIQLNNTLRDVLTAEHKESMLRKNLTTVANDTCRSCDLLSQLCENVEKTEWNYWLMTEIFVRLHGGKDYCVGDKE